MERFGTEETTAKVEGLLKNTRIIPGKADE
jgi:hypothetical protein